MTRKRTGIIITLVVIGGALFLNSCGLEEGKETERGRGDTAVDHVNQGHMDLAMEMGDGFLGVGIKCVGPTTSFLTSTKGNGGAGGPTQPVFMDPFCLGVYEVDGTVNQDQFSRYIKYLSAVQSGEGEKAASLATELINAAPTERSEKDPMLR